MAQYDPNILQRFNQKDHTPSPWARRLLTFGSTLFIVAIVVYLGLNFGYRSYLRSAITVQDDALNQLAAEVPVDEQEELVKFYNQLGNLKSILDKHVINSKILPFLDRNTNKKVRYFRLDFEVAQRTINLDGVAESFDILTQQLEAYRRAPEVERFVLNVAQDSERGVLFAASLVIKPTLLK